MLLEGQVMVNCVVELVTFAFGAKCWPVFHLTWERKTSEVMCKECLRRGGSEGSMQLSLSSEWASTCVRKRCWIFELCRKRVVCDQGGLRF